MLVYGWNDANTDATNDYSRDKNAQCNSSFCSGLWVREHVFPRSLGTPNLGFDFAVSYAHYLRSIDSNRNASRSNRKFENGTGSVLSYITLGGNWYPGDSWRGDVARMIMYMYVRYPAQCASMNVLVGATTYSTYGDMPNVFLDLNAAYPLSPYEVNRNSVLNTMQGNRNPFIDNPYLATVIWNGPASVDAWGLLSLTESRLDGLNVYPTVTKDIVHLMNPDHVAYDFKVYSTYGQLVQASTTVDVIDFSGIAKGLYFVTVGLDGEIKTFRIILN